MGSLVTKDPVSHVLYAGNVICIRNNALEGVGTCKKLEVVYGYGVNDCKTPRRERGDVENVHCLIFSCLSYVPHDNLLSLGDHLHSDLSDAALLSKGRVVEVDSEQLISA